MTTATKPSHLKPRPGIAVKVTTRKGLVLGGAALGLPTSVAGMLTAAPAQALAPSMPVTIPAAVKATPPQNVVWLSYGSTGDLVKIAQQRLGGIAVDGSFGPATLGAVRAYQNSHNLYVDGMIGPATWQSLGGFPGTGATAPGGGTTTTPTPPTSPAPNCSVTVLRYGANSALVKVAQQRLGGIATDGDFGVNTLAAVKNFQASKGLGVDGIVGPMTWSALGGFPCGTSTDPIVTPPVTPPPVTPPTTGTGPVSGTAAQVIAYAKNFLGVPYVWGGTTPNGFDCSGLTQYVYAHFGYSLPRVASAQQAALPSTSNPQPGDLVFFGYPAYHVGIYLGNNTMLAAPSPGNVVRIQPIYNTPSGYGRVLR